MSSSNLGKVLAGIALALLGIAPAGAAMIDFEDVAVATTNVIVTGPLMSDGFTFTSSSGHEHLMHIANPTFVYYNGTTLFAFHDATVTLVKTGGGTFSLGGFDLGEVDDQNYARTVNIVGTLFGGGTLAATVTMDGIFDGSGPINDAQQVVLNWTNLTSVTFNGTGSALSNWIGFDNFTASVPLPSSLLLLAAGLALLPRRRT